MDLALLPESAKYIAITFAHGENFSRLHVREKQGDGFFKGQADHGADIRRRGLCKTVRRTSRLHTGNDGMSRIDQCTVAIENGETQWV